MKIDKIEHLMNPLTADKKGNTHKAGGVDFQKIFEEIQINQAGEKQKLSEFGSVSNAVEVPDGPLGPYSFPPLVEFGNSRQAHNRTIQTGDRMLNILEQYQEALGDPGVSLKNLYPMVQSLSIEVQGVNEGAEDLPENDPLKKILGEIGILAAVEVEKFNRGEYVS